MNEALPEAWALWVAGNLIRGRPSAELVEALVTEGHAPELARNEVARLEASAGVVAARLSLRPLLLAHRLRREHLRLGSAEVPVRPALAPARLYDEHVALQQPVVLPDLTEGWPARDWSWQGLVERFGDTQLEVCEGRSSVDQPARRWQGLVARRSFAEVVSRILDPATGDDLYVIANNPTLEGPLAVLLEDARPVSGILPTIAPATSSVWMGPAGTRTPLHHDTADILFCQILGAKEVWMAPPEEIELADHGAGFFGPDLELDRPETGAPFGLGRLARWRVVVEPGQSLLIPAGVWHQVRALAPSLTLTFSSLAHRNDYSWYRPAPPDRERDA